MLSPKKVKWRKQHRLGYKGATLKGGTLNFGEFALKAETGGYVTARQIEAGRIAISRSVKRGGKLWLRVFPDRPVTKKPAEVRMGSGKGSVELWVAAVRPGKILFEINGVTEKQAREAFRLASYKLPIKTRVLTREGA